MRIRRRGCCRRRSCRRRWWLAAWTCCVSVKSRVEGFKWGQCCCVNWYASGPGLACCHRRTRATSDHANVWWLGHWRVFVAVAFLLASSDTRRQDASICSGQRRFAEIKCAAVVGGVVINCRREGYVFVLICLSVHCPGTSIDPPGRTTH